MAYKRVKREYNHCCCDYVCKYIVDSDADFANLPKSAPASEALSPSGKIMIVNASGEWVAFGEG